MGLKPFTPTGMALALLALACLLPGRAASDDGSPLTRQRAALKRWYEGSGPPSPGETFGHYLARVARLQHGVSYAEESPPPGEESLHVELDRFECVSFIESSLAVARCGYGEEPTETCFLRELERSRYREGRLGDYASRLHYFVDWIGDNETRGRIVNLTASLGGAPSRKDFFYVTRRALARSLFPGEERDRLAREVERTEARLSSDAHFVLDRERAGPALGELRDGDIVAFVRERPGLLVHHAGFVLRIGDEPRLLHASSYHGRVILTSRDVTDYLMRRPERRGVIVARPLPP